MSLSDWTREPGVKAYWFCKELKLPHGDGRPIEVGITHEVTGKIVLCKNGLHGSIKPLDALVYAPGPIACRTLHSGEIVTEDDKLASSRRKYLHVADATEVLWKFARLCGFDARDAYPAAWDAWDAWDAARAAARYATQAVAQDKQNKRLVRMLNQLWRENERS